MKLLNSFLCSIIVVIITFIPQCRSSSTTDGGGGGGSATTRLSSTSTSNSNSNNNSNTNNAIDTSSNKKRPPPPPPPPKSSSSSQQQSWGAKKEDSTLPPSSIHLPPPPPPPPLSSTFITANNLSLEDKNDFKFDETEEEQQSTNNENNNENNNEDKHQSSNGGISGGGVSSNNSLSFENNNHDENERQIKGEINNDDPNDIEEVQQIQQQQEEKEDKQHDKSNNDQDENNDNEEEISWIIPNQDKNSQQQTSWDDMERKRLSNSNNSHDVPPNYHNNGQQQQQQQQQHIQQQMHSYGFHTQQRGQEGLPYQPQLAPRNYNFNRIPQLHMSNQQQPPQNQYQQQHFYHQRQHHQQPPQQMMYPSGSNIPPSNQQYYPYNQQQQQQHQNALIPHQHQNQPPNNILQRFASQSINSLADIDTNLYETSSHIASNVSSLFRKTLFNIEGSVTNVKNSVKDNIKEVVHSGFFGVGGKGAPTSSAEASFEWEDDRRKTVIENRRKRMGLWNKDSSGGRDVAGSNPLQEYLDSGGKVESTEHEHEQGGEIYVEADISQGGTTGSICTDQEASRDTNIVSEDVDNSSSLSIDGKTSYPGNPYAAPNQQRHSMGNVDDETQKEIQSDVVDQIDPSTFFISTKTSLPSRGSRQRSGSSKSSWSFDDDDEPAGSKLGSFVRSMTLSLPQLRLPFSSRYRSSGMDDSGWSDDEDWTERKKKINQKSKSSWKTLDKKKKVFDEDDSLHHFDLLDRRSKASVITRKDTTNLLSSLDMNKASRLGREKAILDLMTFAFGMIFLHEVKKSFLDSFDVESLRFPTDWIESKNIIHDILEGVLKMDAKELLHTWAPYAFVAAFLSQRTITVFLQNQIEKQAKLLFEVIEKDVRSSQLYLRLVSGIISDNRIPLKVGCTAQRQLFGAVDVAHLKSFSFMILAIVIASSVSVIKPMISSVLGTAMDVISLSLFKEWPIDWVTLRNSITDLVIPLGHTLAGLLRDEMNKVIEDPMMIASTGCLCVVLLVVSHLPAILGRRHSTATFHTNEEKTKEEDRMTRVVENLGISTSSRLHLQSNDGVIESVMSKWDSFMNSILAISRNGISSSNHFFMQKLAFTLLISSLLSIPIVLNLILCYRTNGTRQNFMTEMILLAFMYGMTSKAFITTLKTSIDAPTVASFLALLSSTVNEVNSTMMNNIQGDLHLSATASPTRGIVVQDLWAAHVTKR